MIRDKLVDEINKLFASGYNNEINLKYREVIALQERIEELEKENAELKERCNILDKSLVTSTKNNIKRQKIIDELKEKNAKLKGSERYRPKWHDVAGGDLPPEDSEVLALLADKEINMAHFYRGNVWDKIVPVIAWCEIPQYTEE